MSVVREERIARWERHFTLHHLEDVEHAIHEWPEKQSIEVPFRTVESHDPSFAQELLHEPQAMLEASEMALHAMLKDRGQTSIRPRIRIQGLPKDRQRVIRNLRSDDIGPFISIDALVTKITSVRPRIHEATFRCTACDHRIQIPQRNEQELIEPLECDPPEEGGCNRRKGQTRFELVLGDSRMTNTQFIELQETPEQLRSGVQPERLMCLAEHDLCGKVNPGDRVIINGIIFVRPRRTGGKETPIFDIFLDVINIEPQNVPLEEVIITDADQARIREVALSADPLNLIRASIAPSVFGEEAIKRSLALQLFGGVRRINRDGTRQRGDIHILLMGDPGVAKSQILTFMADISPRGRFTSGMSASAAGLTAAAVQDAAADGRWTLEAGALVLADQGLAAIDEFDKMNDNDRSAMHEAMEQQRISISKAGINASLNTRCAILAAANPIRGRFEDLEDATFTSQINLKPPLISRFDVIWLLRDLPAQEQDRKVAHHILQNRKSATSELLVLEGNVPDPTRHASEEGTGTNHRGEIILSKDLLRKYVAYAKRTCHPTMSEEAEEHLVEYYANTRKGYDPDSGAVPLTARAMESLIRLAEASARVRLSPTVDLQDAERAVQVSSHWRSELMPDGYDNTALASGVPKKGRSLHDSILGILRRSGEAMDEQTIVLEMERENTPADATRKALGALVRSGSIYTPRAGKYEYAD